MANLVLHPKTRSQLERFIATPSHALLLTGATGMGKQTIAAFVVSELLATPTEKLPSHPYVAMVSPQDQSSVPIETIRGLQKFLQLKTTGSTALRRAIIIERADVMTTEAQNAFLKLLEEPPADTVIILTAENKQSMLPTILSRLQHIQVYVPDAEELRRHFAAQADATAVEQARLLSRNLPGLMYSLLMGEDHPLKPAIQTAKELLVLSPFERLARVESLTKQKGQTAQLLDALLRIAQSAIDQATEKQDNAKITKWHNIRKELAAAQDALDRGANTKLVLTKMLLHI